MKKSTCCDEELAYAPRRSASAAAVCRQFGASETNFCFGQKKSAHLGVNEMRRLRHLEKENLRVKRLVADLALDKHMRVEALSEKRVGGGAMRCGPGY